MKKLHIQTNASRAADFMHDDFLDGLADGLELKIERFMTRKKNKFGIGDEV